MDLSVRIANDNISAMMTLALKSKDESYRISKADEKIPNTRKKLDGYLKDIKKGLETEDQDLIQTSSQALLDILVKELNIVTDGRPIKISTGSKRVVNITPKGKTIKHGHFTYRPTGRHHSIIIASRTGTTNKYTTIKQFMKTFAHELIHVYDTFVLGIRTVHTSGFYIRTDKLYKQFNL